MPKPAVYVTRRCPPPLPALLAEACDATVHPGEGPPSRDELLSNARGKHGLLVLLTDRVDAELLDAAGPQLRCVSSFSVGFDHVDVAECTRRGVWVGYTPGVLTDATADLTLALLFATARRTAEADAWTREGNWKVAWSPTSFLGDDVWGATIGLVGMGRIGQAVARRCRGLNMRVLYYDLARATPEVEREFGVEYRPFDELLAESDFVSLHVNLTEQTRGLIGEAQLKRMKPTSHLLNTARGPVVDEAALARALDEGWIRGAGLDVFAKEPLAADHPLVRSRKAVLLPHVASATHATRGKMSEISAKNLIRILSGEEPLHLVNPDVRAVRPLAACRVV